MLSRRKRTRSFVSIPKKGLFELVQANAKVRAVDLAVSIPKKGLFELVPFSRG